jgi:hypothetical protein
MNLADASLTVGASLVVAVFSSWVTARATARESTRSARSAEINRRIVDLADDLLATSRDVRDSLTDDGACPGCGAGVSPARLVELADRADRNVDLALLHVRDSELRRRLQRVMAVTSEVRRHQRELPEPCRDLLNAAHRLAMVCDQMAEQCLNVVHEGRPVVSPSWHTTPGERVLNWVLNLAERSKRALD